MSPEQNLGKHPPGYPYRISDVAKATGIPKTESSMGQLRRQIDGKFDPPLFPLTDPRGRVWLSEEDFLRVVQSVKGEKDKLNNTDTKIEPKPERVKKIKPQIEPIILPNGEIISAKKDSKTRTVIREVLRSQKEGKPYPAKQISFKRDSHYLGFTTNWIQYVVTTANRILKPYNYELTLYEAEIDGKNTRTCRIIEKKPVLTSSPEPGFRAN